MLTLGAEEVGTSTVRFTYHGDPVPPGVFAPGDMFANTLLGINQYSADGVFKRTLPTGLSEDDLTGGMAFDAASHLYAAALRLHYVAHFGTNAQLLDPFGSGYTYPESLLFDAAGHAYVANNNFGNIPSAYGIRLFDAQGTFLRGLLPGTHVDWMDLRADQRTLLFTDTSAGRPFGLYAIHTVDVLSGELGPDFSLPLYRPHAFRLLPNGEMLVANTAEVVRLNAQGDEVQTYTLPE